jgi:endo-1,3-1,4-beta-glycanase ExoK
MRRCTGRSAWLAGLLCIACGNGNVGDFGAADDAGAHHDSSVLFDDFTYDSPTDPRFLVGWKVSDYGPAVPGTGTFSGESISFVTEPGAADNTLMRVALKTSGTPDTTAQGEVEGPRRFLYGTYASRMRFHNQPVEGAMQTVGPDTGDHIVYAFFAISPRYVPDTDYGELDFQYLPNAGWNGDGPSLTSPTLWTTSWKTRELRLTLPTERDLGEMHVYWMTVSAAAVSYYCDDELLVTHDDAAYLPDSELAVMWNVWLADEQFAASQSGSSRTWAEDVDWFYHVKNETLTLAEIQSAVDGYRKQGLGKLDTLPPPAADAGT